MMLSTTRRRRHPQLVLNNNNNSKAIHYVLVGILIAGLPVDVTGWSAPSVRPCRCHNDQASTTLWSWWGPCDGCYVYNNKCRRSIATGAAHPFSRQDRWITSRQSPSSSSSSSTRRFAVAQAFGEQSYWQTWYQNRTTQPNDSENGAGWSSETSRVAAYSNDDSDAAFSWYASWEEIGPFVEAAGVERHHRILIPGIGLDANLLLDMYHDGYNARIHVMDYASASVEYVQQRWQQAQQKQQDSQINSSSPDTPDEIVSFAVADVRDLPYPTGSIDVIIDKGTLDAVSLCGATPEEKYQNLGRAVAEFQRVLDPHHGIFWSLSGICIEDLVRLLDGATSKESQPLDTDNDNDEPPPRAPWTIAVNTHNDVWITDGGYASNNCDGYIVVATRTGQ